MKRMKLVMLGALCLGVLGLMGCDEGKVRGAVKAGALGLNTAVGVQERTVQRLVAAGEISEEEGAEWERWSGPLRGVAIKVYGVMGNGKGLKEQLTEAGALVGVLMEGPVLDSVGNPKLRVAYISTQEALIVLHETLEMVREGQKE